MRGVYKLTAYEAARPEAYVKAYPSCHSSKAEKLEFHDKLTHIYRTKNLLHPGAHALCVARINMSRGVPWIELFQVKAWVPRIRLLES